MKKESLIRRRDCEQRVGLLYKGPVGGNSNDVRMPAKWRVICPDREIIDNYVSENNVCLIELTLTRRSHPVL